jgi:predicted CXXCH cytochrome family protein
MRVQWILFMVGLLLVSGSPPQEAWASDSSCDDCHRQVLDRGMGKRYVHMPFMKKQCAACHVTGQTVSVPTRREIDTAHEPPPQKVQWLRDVQGVAAQHWILLSPEALGKKLVYKAGDGTNRTGLLELPLPPLGSLSAMENDGRGPAITDVRVSDVRRGISTTATIAWNTDEFSDSLVGYGVSAPDSTKADGKLTREHEILLTGLDKNRTYRFKVTSRDVSGNLSNSDILEFSTSATFIQDTPRHERNSRSAGPVEVTPQLYRQGDRYLAIFEANQPVTLALGIPEEAPERVVTAVAGAPGEESRSHPVLKSELDTNIHACDSCHAYLKQGYSHPVNVFPKPGMVIPKEYSLLPDGRISCMTCHVPHGGDFEYRLVKSGKKDLCLGCHTDY